MCPTRTRAPPLACTLYRGVHDTATGARAARYARGTRHHGRVVLVVWHMPIVLVRTHLTHACDNCGKPNSAHTPTCVLRNHTFCESCAHNAMRLYAWTHALPYAIIIGRN